MKQLDLKPVGLTDRMEHNATAANFAQIEDAFNSNAITAEGMYAELNGKLAAETNARKTGDDSEARDRQAADTKEAQNREIADGKLDNRLNRLDQEKATHDDVNDLRGEMYQIRDDWHDRASHIARGTDVETTKAVVEQILQEKGLI